MCDTPFGMDKMPIKIRTLPVAFLLALSLFLEPASRLEPALAAEPVLDPEEIIPQEPLYRFLSEQEMNGFLITYGGLPNSHPLRRRSYVYANALAAEAWLRGEELARARTILEALSRQVTPDGKIVASFDLVNGVPVPVGAVFAGHVAFVAYTMLRHQQKTADTRFQDKVTRMLGFLLRLKDPLTGLIKGGEPVRWISTEHNLRVHRLLILAEQLFQRQEEETIRQLGETHREEADRLGEAILTYLFNRNYFRQGFGDNTLALDAQYLGIPFLLERGNRAEALAVLNFIQDRFQVTVRSADGQTLTGYRAFANDPAHVWGEGTLEVYWVARRLGPDGQRVVDLLKPNLSKLRAPNGAILDSIPRIFSPNAGGEFLDFPTVAATALAAGLPRPSELLFLRGDANGDGKVDVSDAIRILQVIFRGETPPSCLDTADSNDDGQIDVSDAVYLLLFLFRGGAAPPDPGPYLLGPDPTPDTLACAQQ